MSEESDGIERREIYEPGNGWIGAAGVAAGRLRLCHVFFLNQRPLTPRRSGPKQRLAPT